MKSLPLICLLTIVVFSCLEPEGENFVDIPRPDESTVIVNLNDYASGDTILVDAITNFTYKVSPEHWISETSARLDEDDIYVAYTQFQINPLNYSKGYHRLFFKAVMQTDSHSLLNMVSGSELMTVQREFVVIIENEPPASPDIQLDTINGTVTLYWTACEKKNFVSYTITKYCGNPDDDYNPSTCYTETITDKTITSWTDHEYVGRYARYYIEVATTLQSTSDDLTLQWTPNFVTTVEDGYATVHWRKPFFYANIAKVEVSNWPPLEIPTTDTLFALPDRLQFGYQYRFTLDFIPATAYHHRMWYAYYGVGTEHSYPAVMPYLYHPAAHRYYGFSYPVTVVMDENLNVLESMQIDYADCHISDNGSYFISLLNGKFYYTDPNTLSTTLAYTPAEESVRDFTISNDGLLGYHSSAGYSVVDLSTGETKFNISWPWFEMITCYLSPSGKYLSYGGKKIYEYNGVTFVLKGEFNQYNYGFLFLDNDNILVYGEDSLKEYDINSLNVVATYDLGLDGYLGDFIRDPVSHKVVCSQSGRFFVINTDTKKSYLVGGIYVRLFNNTLFASTNFSLRSIDCSYIEQP